MAIYQFDQTPDRRQTESAKWHYYEQDVIPLWVADMDFVSPEPVIQALRQRVEHGVFGYPDDGSMHPRKEGSLPMLIVQRMATRYGWQIQPEDVVFIPGVVNGFNLACQAVAQPGEGVLVQTPVYPPILGAAEKAGLSCQSMQLTCCPSGAYEIDWDAFEGAITDQTRIFILCNPHNPVGRVFRQDELQRMAEICLRRGIVICSDEIHGDLIFSGYNHIPVASLHPEIAQNSITLLAPSKTYNLAGLKCSMAIIPDPKLRKKYQQARKGLVGGVNLMGLVAAQAAYRDGQEWLDQLLVYLEANRDALYDYLQRELPEIHMAKPEGTYLAWLDCRQAAIDGNPYEFFLKEARVALNDGVTFGPGGEGFVRLNFGCARSLLLQALQQMKTALRR